MKKDKNFIISIDQGTTSSRAILFNLKGQPVYSSQKVDGWNTTQKKYGLQLKKL
jgi:glycerol kinase